ncbi:MAG: hypothetical protein SFV51_32070 [Bryobacteraceae bacterium]|nr:hypothetical protein [Bryobacteraceae bacterium]
MLTAAILTGRLEASGSYSTRPPRPPEAVIQNSRRYELGKTIFAGKLELRSPAPGAERGQTERVQAERLKELQSRLPTAKRLSVDLPAFAGKLTPDQMAALAYFLEIRYKIK